MKLETTWKIFSLLARDTVQIVRNDGKAVAHVVRAKLEYDRSRRSADTTLPQLVILWLCLTYVSNTDQVVCKVLGDATALYWICICIFVLDSITTNVWPDHSRRFRDCEKLFESFAKVFVGKAPCGVVEMSDYQDLVDMSAMDVAPNRVMFCISA